MPTWDVIFQNLGVPLEDILLLGVVLGSIVMSIKDIRIGLISAFIFMWALFIILYELGMDYIKALLAALIALVLLALSLLVSHSKGSKWVV